MYSLTFNQELALMLIDKAAIGLVGVGVWIFVQRRLEAYKARQALWTEISKERVEIPNHTAIDQKCATPELSDTIKFLSHLNHEKISELAEGADVLWLRKLKNRYNSLWW